MAGGRRSNQDSLHAFAYYRARPGQVFHYTEVAEAIKADERLVNAALARAVVKHPEWGIERVGAGQYRYLMTKATAQPEVAKAPPDNSEMFEKVGTTADGTIIVRNESGVLYRLSDMV